MIYVYMMLPNISAIYYDKKFNSEKKFSYKYKSKNISSKSEDSNIFEIRLFECIFANIGESMYFLNKKNRNKNYRKLNYF